MSKSIRLNPSLLGFRCLRCEELHPVSDLFEGCPSCAARGHASSVAATYDPGSTAPGERFPLLGVPSQGEGDTPLLPLPAIAEELEMDRVWLKAEGQNPTGSHKDRMSAFVVARALMLGSPRVIAASSGNAGVSLASYAARAGLACTILTREGIPGTWNRDMLALGTELIVAATPAERWARMAKMVQAGEGYPATNYLAPPVGSNPFGVQGYKAVGHELASALAETPPDAVLMPSARGDLLWGTWEGLREAWPRDSPNPLPKMVAIEPIERAIKVLAGADYRSHFEGKSDQISIAGNDTTGQVEHTLRASDGCAVTVGDAEAEAVQRELAHRGLFLERCSAAPLAALRQLRESGFLPAGSRAVLVGSSDGRREAPRNQPGTTT